MDAKSAKDLHFYEPAKGHGLKHDPFNAIVAPRPIGWISSRDSKGNINLAPYSFFNGFCYHPPIIGFSSTSWKDSVQNVQDSGEFEAPDLPLAALCTCTGMIRFFHPQMIAQAVNKPTATIDQMIDFVLAGLAPKSR